MAFNPVLIVAKGARPDWYPLTEPYARPRLTASLRQLLNSLLPYLLLLTLMIFTVHAGYPYGLTLALAVPAAGFFIRIFIIFHDCTHGAFLPSPRWNRNVGYLCGVLTFTAFGDWRRTHAGHHIRAGDLDRRGVGDVWLLTVDEYRTAPLLRRLLYRLYRNPFIYFGLGPGYYFLLRNRWPSKGAKKRDVLSVVYTDLALAVIWIAMSLIVGLEAFLLVQLPVMLLATTAGVWLFYVQHQFQGVYWARHEQWDPVRVAMEGASFYRLPKLLQWFSGHIGYHHLHHARPAIPNYNLPACHAAVPALQAVRSLTLRDSLRCLRWKLYAEERCQLVGFGALREKAVAGNTKNRRMP